MALKRRSDQALRLLARRTKSAQRLRRRHLGKIQVSFLPPKPHSIVIKLFGYFRSFILRQIYKIKSVDITDRDLLALRGYTDMPLLVVPNHPTKADPAVMFFLSAEANRNFLYVSNREQFNEFYGLYGKLLQRLGAYSLVRGMKDEKSFAMTLSSLQSKDFPIVIFSEGGRYSTADQAAAHLDGVFRLAKLSYKKSVRNAPNSNLRILPVALTYIHENSEEDLQRALDRLEIAVGVEFRPDGKTIERIRSVAMEIVASNEVALGITADPDARLSERCYAILNRDVQRISQELGCDVSSTEDIQDKIRNLQNHFANAVCSEPSLNSEYDERLFKAAFARRRAVRLEIERLERWSHIRPGTIEDSESVEACMDLVSRLELEVFGKIKLKSLQRVIVRLAEPILLKPSTEEEDSINVNSDPRSIATEVQRRIQGLIDSLKE